MNRYVQRLIKEPTCNYLSHENLHSNDQNNFPEKIEQNCCMACFSPHS